MMAQTARRRIGTGTACFVVLMAVSAGELSAHTRVGIKSAQLLPPARPSGWSTGADDRAPGAIPAAGSGFVDPPRTVPEGQPQSTDQAGQQTGSKS
jgi:hypothetical protein